MWQQPGDQIVMSLLPARFKASEAASMLGKLAHLWCVPPIECAAQHCCRQQEGDQ